MHTRAIEVYFGSNFFSEISFCSGNGERECRGRSIDSQKVFFFIVISHTVWVVVVVVFSIAIVF